MESYQPRIEKFPLRRIDVRRVNHPLPHELVFNNLTLGNVVVKLPAFLRFWKNEPRNWGVNNSSTMVEGVSLLKAAFARAHKVAPRRPKSKTSIPVLVGVDGKLVHVKCIRDPLTGLRFSIDPNNFVVWIRHGVSLQGREGSQEKAGTQCAN